MSDKTGIEWTDTTWNPTTGCDRVSAGCDHCYAMTLAKRLKGMGSAKYQTDGDPRTSGPGFGVAMHEDALDAPLHWRAPRKVFVNSMSDLFHDKVTDEFIADVFAVMALTPRHTYQVLTKRHARMRALLGSDLFIDRVTEKILTRAFAERPVGIEWHDRWEYPVRNAWLGVSVESQQWADIRIPALLDTPAAVRFLSCEPLLGPVNLGVSVPIGSGDDRKPMVDWVIAGGESGPGARPMHPDWARGLRDQCQAASVPFLFKQWGAWSPVDPEAKAGHSVFDYVTNDDACQIVDTAGRLRGRPWPGWAIQDGTRDASTMRRYSKHDAGRMLDGRTWDEYPAGAA